MRLAILTAGFCLSLCAAPLALGQSPFSGLINPQQPQVAEPPFQFPGTDFSKLPPTLNHADIQQNHVFVLPPVKELRPPAKLQIDPQIIIRPSKAWTSDQPQGSLVAQNVYPGLRMLPIGSSAGLKQIPTDWKKLKLESIPITWPQSSLQLINGNNAAEKPAPGK